MASDIDLLTALGGMIDLCPALRRSAAAVFRIMGFSAGRSATILFTRALSGAGWASSPRERRDCFWTRRREILRSCSPDRKGGCGVGIILSRPARVIRLYAHFAHLGRPVQSWEIGRTQRRGIRRWLFGIDDTKRRFCRGLAPMSWTWRRFSIT